MSAPAVRTPAERMGVAFGRVLRGAGVTVPVGHVLMFVEALGNVGVSEREDVYWVARSTLLRRPEDIAVFDLAFHAFWDRALTAALEQHAVVSVEVAVPPDGDDDHVEAPPLGDEPTTELSFSAAELLRERDFAAYDEHELRLVRELMARLRFAGSTRRSFRRSPSRRGRRPDLQATLRASIAAGGEPIRRRWSEPGERVRRVVLLLDVSGSMEPYARAMLLFVQAAVAAGTRVEAFAMGTGLTRLTKELHSRDLDEALRRAGHRVPDWSGGTRLGECLRTFNDEWGVRGMARGAVVVVLSDGWDLGDPRLLGEQMQRLHRISYATVWANPLKATPGYAPLARGMAAALPYVDRFVEGHSLAAMEELAAVIASAPRQTRL